MKTYAFKSVVGAFLVAGALAMGGWLAPGHGSPAPASLAPAAPPLDKITLKDGKIIEGHITREVEGYIWFTQLIGEVENKLILGPDKIAKIERASETHPAEAAAAAAAAAKAAAPKGESGTPGIPRAVVLTIEGTVGIQLCAKPLLEVIPLLEKDRIDIVVFKINSGGGLLNEVKPLSDAIHNEYKKRFRVVAWIESAISAAAMTGHNIEDIYFMANGNYGACTAFSGRLEAAKGRGLEEILKAGRELSDRGGHPREIMRAMQISGDDAVLQELQISPPSGLLSADIDENGDVTWHQDTSGEYVLNPQGELKILTFNSEQAAKFKFSKGTANTIADLTKAMGYQELEWVGTEKPGSIFPVCPAEEVQQKWREDISKAETNMGVYQNDYGRSLASARAAQSKEDRGMWINKARNALAYLKSLCKKYPNFELLQGLTKEFFEEQEEILRKLSK